MQRCLLLITKYEIFQIGGIVSNQTLIVVPPVEFCVRFSNQEMRYFCEKYLCFVLGASLVDKSFIFIFSFTLFVRILYD